THAVPIDNEALAITIANSHHHPPEADEQYHERRKQCADAVEALKSFLPDIETLRDVNLTQLDAHKKELDPVLVRRARHVITENHRVRMAADALANCEYETLGFLMNESHRFQRDEMEASCPPIETLVEAALDTPGVYGSRLTGIGFGGSTVTLVQPHAVDRLIERLERASRHRNEKQADCFRAMPSSGAHALGIYGWEDEGDESQGDVG
ncbi:MAG: galactokinase, partial [Planctomycetota bacterium]